jgi:hypothetical protein
VNNIYSVTHSIPKQTASYVIYQTAMDQTVHTSLVQEKEMPTSQQQNFMSVQAAEPVCTGRRDRDSAGPTPSPYIHCPSSLHLCAAALRDLGPLIPHNESERASLFAVCYSTPASLWEHGKKEQSISSCFSSAFKQMTPSFSLHSICQNSLFL